MTVVEPAVECCAPLAAEVLDHEQAIATAELFKALSDPARVRIVNLSPRATSPCAPASSSPALGLAQPTVSHHLKKLTDAGLLAREQRGKWAVLLARPEAVERLAAGRRPERSVLLMSATADELREEVRRRYAESARAVIEGTENCGCGSGSCCADGATDAATFGEALYDAEQRGALPEAAALASLGCGNPTAVAELREGETVLDLGSGGGIDVILSAKRVGPTGIAYGLDMTDEMLALASRTRAKRASPTSTSSRA